MDRVAGKYMLSLQSSKFDKEQFEIIDDPEIFNILMKPKSRDFVTIFSRVHSKSTCNAIIEHRHTRFHYYDILDILENILKNHHMMYVMSMPFYISTDSFLPKKDVLIFFTLFVIELIYNTSERGNWIGNISDKIEVVSIGTNVFDQRNVILTERSKLYSWCSTLGCIWLFFVILYFVRKMHISLHGFSETFDLSIDDSRSHELTRPDVIQVDSGNLNIFTSYFYSILFGKKGFMKAFCFTLAFAFWFFSVIAEINIVSKGTFKCILIIYSIICSILFLFLFPITVVFLICFSLILFTPELLIKVTDLGLSDYYPCYVLLLLLFINASLLILFWYKDWTRDLLFQGNLLHFLFWPTWPVLLIVFLTKKFSAAVVHIVHIFILLFLCILGLLFFLQDSKVHGFTSYNSKYLHTLSYWLFFPVHFALLTFCSSHKRVISNVIEQICTALFVAYLMNFFYLHELYPLLTSLDQKQNLYLYIMLVFDVIVYLIKIYREWYSAYDKFLNDVISFIRDQNKCIENKARYRTVNDCIALIHNHNDSEEGNDECQYPELRLSQGEITNDKFKIKGLMLLMKGSNVYAPSDFFFEVINLPGAPGPIKKVIMKELLTLVFLRLFPALFIYWLCNVMYLIDFEKYDTVIKVVIGRAFISHYKEFFFHRKISLVNVKSNIAFQRQIQMFLDSYESWYFVCNRD